MVYTLLPDSSLIRHTLPSHSHTFLTPLITHHSFHPHTSLTQTKQEG